MVAIPAGEHKGYAVRAQTAILGHVLLVVAHLLDELLDGDGLLVRVEVSVKGDLNEGKKKGKKTQEKGGGAKRSNSPDIPL